MNKLFFASAVTAGILSASIAQADISAVFENWQDRAYAQAKLGTTDILGLDDNALTVTGVAGLHTPSIHPMLSFEADLTFTLADAESSLPSSVGSTKVEASAFSLGGYAVASYDKLPIENLTPFVRAGLAYTSVDVSYSNGVASVDGDGSEIDLGLTAGVRYQVNDQFGVVADYTTVSSLDTLNIGIQYNF